MAGALEKAKDFFALPIDAKMEVRLLSQRAP